MLLVAGQPVADTERQVVVDDRVDVEIAHVEAETHVVVELAAACRSRFLDVFFLAPSDFVGTRSL